MSPPKFPRRISTDVMKMRMAVTDFKVELIDKNNYTEFTAEFRGPKGSDYEGGVWKVRVQVTESYPLTPPIFFFENKIFHPNIHDESGMICLDVFEHNWTFKYDLLNAFQIFLPQLLTYPNPKDPVNVEAAKLLLDDKPAFVQTVKEYIERYAKPQPEPEPEPAKEPYDDDTEDYYEDDTDDGRSDDTMSSEITEDFQFLKV